MADNFTTFTCDYHEILAPQPPGTLRACSGIALNLAMNPYRNLLPTERDMKVQRSVNTHPSLDRNSNLRHEVRWPFVSDFGGQSS